MQRENHKSRWVVFSHGLESGPWGTKIAALASRAEARGHRVESIDYRGITDPALRVERLLESVRGRLESPVLVGSSMGAHVAAAASIPLGAAGLFLMAPAVYMPGYEALTPEPARCPMTIVHGWNDEVVPVENAIRYAQQHRATLHLLDDDHRLQHRPEDLAMLFDLFLDSLDRSGV
jgi:pimeloyl-ACP methyl ester carboxylesterase